MGTPSAEGASERNVGSLASSLVGVPASGWTPNLRFRKSIWEAAFPTRQEDLANVTPRE